MKLEDQLHDDRFAKLNCPPTKQNRNSRMSINHCFHTFAPQKSYLFARDNGAPCSQMIFEQTGFDNGNVYGVSPSFLIRILHGFDNGSGFAPSSNLFSRILFNVS